ncbi:MAG: desulfoferrodoxin [Candidatus Nealsonbacteria bacterium]|nr:desulfoferrodoxin [Candidatus Nealsonbacteria bacterium]
MKRRDFLSAAAGIGAGTLLTGTAAAAGEKRPAEKRRQVYQCTECSTVVEVLVAGKPPTLMHCGEPMELIEDQTAAPAENKHVPVIEKVDGGYKVKVGSAAHPMTDAHYIAWIELIADGRVHRQYLNPGDKPEAVFLVEAKEVAAREHCNLHGVWKDK